MAVAGTSGSTFLQCVPMTLSMRCMVGNNEDLQRRFVADEKEKAAKQPCVLLSCFDPAKQVYICRVGSSRASVYGQYHLFGCKVKVED